MPNRRGIAGIIAVGILASVGSTPATAAGVEPPGDEERGQVLEERAFAPDWLPDSVGSATWVRYVTSDVLGDQAESTGFVLYPDTPAPSGGWPVVSWAHGTQGTADACAPTVSGPGKPDP